MNSVTVYIHIHAYKLGSPICGTVGSYSFRQCAIVASILSPYVTKLERLYSHDAVLDSIHVHPLFTEFSIYALLILRGHAPS